MEATVIMWRVRDSLLLWLAATCAVLHVGRSDQELVDSLAANIELNYTVVTNYPAYEGRLQFVNTGTQSLTGLAWTLYFSHIRDIEPEKIRPNGTLLLGASGLRVFHVNGVLYRIEPTADFAGFLPSAAVQVTFTAAAWMATRTDVMPNWYFASSEPGVVPRVMASTAGESLDFVTDFTRPEQWKRVSYDQYDPYTAQSRWDLYNHGDLGSAPCKILPNPVVVSLDESATVTVDPGVWFVTADSSLQTEANFLANKIGAPVVAPGDAPPQHYIALTIGEVLDGDQPVTTDESYRIDVRAAEQTISITGRDGAGVFYGAQSFLSLFDASRDIPSGHVVDYPRFPYRGMHLDVSRNFHPKDRVKKLLEIMAMYKLNRFHFHVTDDEGWRVEIPGIPELTEVGARRCHDLTGDSCIMPQLGSPPNEAAEFYTVADYKEILTYAAERHIVVIPEFDMPGHAHAAVNAMLARYRKYKDVNETLAAQFLLNDLEDKSEYLSTQAFTDNGINPCIDSTYAFVEQLVSDVVQMHADIQPLKVFNFGGDEVAKAAWSDSPACHLLGRPNATLSNDDLKELFAVRVAGIAHEHGLDLAAWEDGLMQGSAPFNRTAMPMDNVYGYFWDNVWEWGQGQRAYVMANNDYKVVLSHATHLYYDHPYEPDPEERGYYWATRIVPTRKTFSYTPLDVYANMDVDRMGSPLNREQICATYGCQALNTEKKDNIVGIQGHLFCETVRNSAQMDYMIFPRMLALAERAWHQAGWETTPEGPDRDAQRDVDYEKFTNTLGYKEMSRLEKLGVEYRIPPTGARITSNLVLEARAGHPGLPIQYSTDGGNTWLDYNTDVKVAANTNVLIITRSFNRARSGRQVELTAPPAPPPITTGAGTAQASAYLLALSFLAAKCSGLLRL